MYDMNIKKIHNSIMHQMLEIEKIDLFNEEDDKRTNELTARLNNTALDEDFKRCFNNDMWDTMVSASLNSFENGLNVGLSLLWNILNAEPPEINVMHKETPAEKNDFIKDFSRIYESLPIRERMYLMTKIYEYEEKYNEGILKEI